MASLLATLRPELLIAEGRGVRIRDNSGKWYLDARSGAWNVSLGFSNTRVIDSVTEQLQTLPYAPQFRDSRPAEITVRFANELAARLPSNLRRVRFGSTGSQMTEAAVLLSRCVRIALGDNGRREILTLRRGYHGTGGLASALSGAAFFEDLYGPLAPGVHQVDVSSGSIYPTVEDVRSTLDSIGDERVTALILEPIIGSGVIVPPRETLHALRTLTRERGIHFIADEAVTGMGRAGAICYTGEMGVAPDMLVLGKGITSGYIPCAALAVSEVLYDTLFDGPVRNVNGTPMPLVFLHGSTSDGSPPAMAAGLAVLDLLEDGVLEHVRRVGAFLETLLQRLKADNPTVSNVRGTGLMYGFDLLDVGSRATWSPQKASAFVQAAAERGLLVSAFGNSVMLVPPLIITEEELKEVVDILDAAIRAVAEHA